jgi:hypothetical protein
MLSRVLTGWTAMGGGSLLRVDHRWRLRTALLTLAAVLLGMLAAAATPALATTQRSSQVAIILGEGTTSSGMPQTAGSVAGSPQDSFDQFSFTHLTEESIEAGILAQYDTVVLNQVFTRSLSETQRQVLSNFVTNGGKLIIHDSDGTEGNEYEWLPVPATTGQSCENCGKKDGEARIVENNTIVSSDPSSPYYVDLGELPGASDAVGDANLLVTTDPRWDEDIRATNDQNAEGAADAYASDGGLILYNGFDADFLLEELNGGGPGIYPSGNDWLDKIWYDELNAQWNPDNLPHSTPVVGSGGHCGFRSIKVGVAVICAEAISGTPTETTASGNVVIDGGVAVGNGPLKIDQETKKIATTSPASISLLRRGGALSLGSAEFSIDATGTTDPTSGKSGLAAISFAAANLGPLGTLRVGDLPFSLPVSGSVSMYLDNELDGGLVGSAAIQLPMLGKLETSGALSVGFFANSPSPVVVLGGAAHFGAVDLGAGWKFEGLDLAYQQASDTWTASGGLAAPVGSLNASGSLVNGQLDALHVSIGGQNVPLGDSGFFFTSFGGGFSGLVNGPLKIDASTAGFWGVPKAPVEPFYLDNVTITVDFSGSVSLDGAVSLVFKDNSPIHGELHLKLGLHPFAAVGSASMAGELAGISLKAGGGAGFTTKHFTAAAHGTVKMLGLSGSGEVIASDKGLGGSGTLCAPFHVICKSLAFAGTWQQYGKLDIPAIVGGEPRKLITVSGVAAVRQSAAVNVPAGRTLLFLAVSDSSGAPDVRLRAPNGRTYDSSHSTRTVLFTRQPRFGLTSIAVVDPGPGRWVIRNGPAQQTRLHISAQTVGSLDLIHASRPAPASSAHHPLSARAHIQLRWTSAHLPPNVRVTLVRRSKPHETGVGIAGNLPANGHYSLPVSKLAAGRNYLTLAATLDGVPFEEISFRGQAWRSTPPVRHKATPHKR